MNLESLNPSQKEPFKRSDLLTVLCVLTFIGSGLASFSNLTQHLVVQAYA